VETDFFFDCSGSSFSSWAKQFSTCNPGKTRKSELLGKPGNQSYWEKGWGMPGMQPQLIIPAPAELMAREGHLLGAISPVLRELAGRGVRNCSRQAPISGVGVSGSHAESWRCLS